jgi:hypothetical protein
MTYTEEQYPFIVNNLIKYIQKIKETEKTISLVDIIMDYCFKFNIEIELIGDAISSDLYFKSFIEKDCEINKIFKTKKNINIDEW